MKQRYLTIMFVFIFIINLYAQNDPFNIAGTTIRSSDMLLLWSEGDNPDSVSGYEKIYNFLPGNGLAVNERLITGERHPADNAVLGNRQMSIANANFNGDSYDEVVAVWEGANQSIEVMIQKFDSSETLWAESLHFTIAGPVLPYASQLNGHIFVNTANFDDDVLDEFVIAYGGADSTIHIELYDADGNAQAQLIDAVNDENLLPAPVGINRFSITTGDLDGDGNDEIIIAGFRPDVLTNGGSYVRVYDVVNGKLENKTWRVIQSRPSGYGNSLFNVAVASGQFKDDSKEEIAFVATFNGGGDDEDLSYLYIIEAAADLTALIIDRTKAIEVSTLNWGGVSMDCGDFNADERDEIAFAVGGKYFIYSMDDDLNLAEEKSGSVASGGQEDLEKYSYNFLSINEVDGHPGDEMVVAESFYGNESMQHFSIIVYSASGGDINDMQSIGYLSNEEEIPEDWPGRNFALVTGNFDGKDYRIGQPNYYSLTDFVEPIVILNAPPVHFDVFDENIFDINNCYLTNDCGFFSDYEKENSEIVETSIKVHRDWSTQVGVQFSGQGVATPLGVGVTIDFENYLKGNFGKEFNRDSLSQTERTISVKVRAAEDDQIFATVTNYDVWEYPIYNGSSEIATMSFTVIDPLNTQGRWFPSKSWSANTYIPNHEVGNILSYKPYPDLTLNPNLEQTIRASYESDEFTLSSNTSYDWSVTRQDFTQTSADTTTNKGLDLRLQYNIAFFELHTDFSGLSSHTVTVTEGINLTTHLGAVDLSYGETRFAVTPYAYWGNNGSVVVDFAAKPEIAPPGFPETWWQEKYGHYPDPAFILPWRYDPEKGFGISEEAKRTQTKAISFDPVKPVPGDTVTISVDINNFSLLPTTGPVKLKLYIGDPDSGGTIITDIAGNTGFLTNGIIDQQGRTTIKIEWVVANELTQLSRIYAVLDPDNEIEEVHQNNNKGWTVLGEGSINAIENSKHVILTKIQLLQNYPNPFNPQTTIEYVLPKASDVSLKIFNTLGEEVTSLVKGYYNAGGYKVIWNAEKYSSGVYYYRLKTKYDTRIKKLILLK